MNDGILTQGTTPALTPRPLLGRPAAINLPLPTPSKILPANGNLELWLEVERSSIGGSVDGVAGVSLNAPVRFLRDKSGHNRHAVRDAADSAMPTLIAAPNNRLALSFDGGDMIGGPWVAMPAQQTTFAVVRHNGVGGRIFTQQGTNAGAFDDAAGSGNYIPFIHSAAGAVSQYNNAFVATATFPSFTWSVLCAVRNRGAHVTLLNNAVVGTGSGGFSTAIAFTRYSIGANSWPANFFQGAVAEIVVYSRDLEAAERTAVFDYLGRKYAIAQA